MFITICSDLRNLCQKLEKVHPGDSVTNGLLEKCKVLLNDSNDFTALRATVSFDTTTEVHLYSQNSD
ncbi:hypothetical protein TURU_154606 [Turdus rufiventris]|nr:hypothetical protein TURU_154606 [Turdus rufiventris]